MTIAEHSDAEAKSMFFRGDDGRVAFYPHLYGYGYWLDGEGRQAQLLQAARHIDRLSMIVVVALFGLLFVANTLLPVSLRPLPWLVWLPAMAASAMFCNRLLMPHLAGLTRTTRRKFLLSPQAIASMQSMARLAFVFVASGLAAIFGVSQFMLGGDTGIALAIAGGFGGAALWAAIIIRTKLAMQREG